MLENGLGGESGKFVTTGGLEKWADLEPRRLNTTKRPFEFLLITESKQDEMRVVEFRGAKRGCFKSSVRSLHNDLCWRQVTTDKDVNVALAGRS